MAGHAKHRRNGAVAILPPPEWRALSPGHKMEQLLSYSLDDAYTVAKWPVADCNPSQLFMKFRQFEVLVRHGMALAVAAMKAEQSAAALQEVRDDLKRALQGAE